MLCTYGEVRANPLLECHEDYCEGGDNVWWALIMIFNVNIFRRLCPELKLFCRGPNFEHATLSLNDQQQFAQSDNWPEASDKCC